MTLHSALIPQLPAHGSAHFLLKQALSGGHSELAIHSGLQAGGEPMYCGKQAQIACPLDSLQLLKGPQGV
jgi:hypothetical protein